MWKKLRSFPGLFHLGFGLTLCTRSTTSCGWLCIYLLRYSSKYVQWHSVINFSCRNNFPCMPEERHFGSKRFLHTIHRHTVNVDDRRIPASTWYTAIHNSGEDSGVDEHAMVCMRHCIPDTHIIHISGLHESMWTKFLFCRRKNLMLHP